MLKVTIKENVVDSHWKVGTIRMSEYGNTVIMIVNSGRSKNTEFVYLKAEQDLLGQIYSNDKEQIMKQCPVVVENAELIIGGGSND